jgi:Ribbon-helix-helix protein, copG family
MQLLPNPQGPSDISMPAPYAEMMRTTIRMDDALLAQAKSEAIRTGRTLTQVIEDAVRESLARAAAAEPSRSPVLLPTFAGGGLQPGVDLDSSASLGDLMDRDDPD